MTTQIYFVRHGEVFNPQNVWYGRLPRFGLSEHGKEEIVQTAKYLATQEITQLYTSPVLRARQTALIIQKELTLPIHFSKDLMEIKSSLQGRSFEEIARRNFDVFAAADKPDIVGETIEDIAQRVKRFILRVIQNHPGERVVAVSHGDPIMIVKAMIEGLPIVNESLRPGKENYVHHGEIYLVESEEKKPLTLTKLFQPQ